MQQQRIRNRDHYCRGHHIHITRGRVPCSRELIDRMIIRGNLFSLMLFESQCTKQTQAQGLAVRFNIKYHTQRFATRVQRKAQVRDWLGIMRCFRPFKGLEHPKCLSSIDNSQQSAGVVDSTNHHPIRTRPTAAALPSCCIGDPPRFTFANSIRPFDGVTGTASSRLQSSFEKPIRYSIPKSRQRRLDFLAPNSSKARVPDFGKQIAIKNQMAVS